MDESLKHHIDLAAVAASVAGLLGALPVIVSALTCIWWLIRIYETRTVQRLLGRHDAAG